MEEVIKELQRASEYYGSWIDGYKRDIEHEKRLITTSTERIEKAEEKLRDAQAFIDTYQAAIEILGGTE